MCSSHFQSKSHVLLPWKSLCFNCQSLFHTGSKVIRLDSHGVNTMELSRFSSENPALRSFVVASSSQGHLVCLQMRGREKECLKMQEQIANWPPVTACPGSLCLHWPAVAAWNSIREKQVLEKTGASVRRKVFLWKCSENNIFQIHIQHFSCIT